MDQHRFKSGDWNVTISAQGLVSAAGPAGAVFDLNAALCAETLRLAEELQFRTVPSSEYQRMMAERDRLRTERDKFKRWAGEGCGKAARAQQDADEARAQVAEQARTIDRLKEEKGLLSKRLRAEARVQELTSTVERLRVDERDYRAQLASLGAENYALAQKARRRKAKIRKLKEELRVIGHQLEAARVLSAQAEREAVLAYLRRVASECFSEGDSSFGSFAEGLHNNIKEGTHRTRTTNHAIISPEHLAAVIAEKLFGIVVASGKDFNGEDYQSTLRAQSLTGSGIVWTFDGAIEAISAILGAHLTAPASPPQEPSPSEKSAPE